MFRRQRNAKQHTASEEVHGLISAERVLTHRRVKLPLKDQRKERGKEKTHRGGKRKAPPNVPLIHRQQSRAATGQRGRPRRRRRTNLLTHNGTRRAAAQTHAGNRAAAHQHKQSAPIIHKVLSATGDQNQRPEPLQTTGPALPAGSDGFCTAGRRFRAGTRELSAALAGDRRVSRRAFSHD